MKSQWNKKYYLAVLIALFSNTVYAQLNIFACEPEWASLTRTLAGNNAKVYSATNALQDPHYIQARPSLIAKVARADMLVCTGAELEVGWLPLLLRKSGNSHIQSNQPGYFMAADQVALLEKPTVLDRSLGDIHAAGNPHIQFDPYRIQQVANALTLALMNVDPTNSADYQKNLKQFTDDWHKATIGWERKFQNLKEQKIVAGHNSWIYLEQWLGLERVAELEPKPGIPASSSYLAKVLSKLQQQPANMILHAENQNDKAVLWLAEKTGLRVVYLPFSPSDKEDLIQWFNRFLNQLSKAGA